MPISFATISIGSEYSRPQLAEIWGYQSFHAIARGVVTPQHDNKIVLFVTHEKQESSTQYADQLVDGCLFWEGPTDHFAEDRMVAAKLNGEKIHLFYRDRHHGDFIYYGQIVVEHSERFLDRSSRFKFCLTDWNRK